MGLGTPLRPSRLAFSWTPDSIQYNSTDAEAGFEHHEHQRQHQRYIVHLPSEEIEKWSERIVVDENGYHMQPSASSPSPPMHPADKSGSSTSSLDFEALDENIVLESSEAADLDSEDEDEELMYEGGEMILPHELELPPGLHGPANGRRGRASYYMPRPPAEVVNAANGANSPYRYRPESATNTIYEDDPSYSSSSPSKPGLSLKTRTATNSHGREYEHSALLLDSPTQAVPQDAVNLEAFGNGDIVVGTVGVPQDVGLGVICPQTPMPPPSSVPLFAEDDVEGQDIEMGANTVIDADAEGGTSLSPSHSSDSASVNTASTGSDELVKVAMAQIQVRTPGSIEGGEVVDATEASDICGKPHRPPRNPSRFTKGETGTTGTSEAVAEGLFSY